MIFNGIHYRIIPGTSSLQIIRNFSAKRLRVDDIVVKIKSCARPELVPRGYVPQNLSAIPQSDLNVIKWLIQKDQLRQDVFLIGSPGFRRRRLVMQYLELTEKEYEYLPLTRDITESDIKQRREIKDGSAFYVDQAAIKAAVHGRVLVLDGIEKAERNVLPILNNLLENREVQLDDGRFLVPPDRYDSLLKQYGEEELRNNFRLVRVHEDFRVVALGLPVPKFSGYSLDPPLRSRFQGMSVNPKFFKDFYEEIRSLTPNVEQTKISDLLSFAYCLLTDESMELSLPEFPVDSLRFVSSIWNKVPEMSTNSVLKSCYPYHLILKKDAQLKVANILKTFNIIEPENREMSRNFSIAKKVTSVVLDVNVSWNGEERQLQISRGFGKDSNVSESTIDSFVLTPSRRRLLTDLLLSHSSHDFCLVGPKGCGKSSVADRFASLLGYKVMPIMLYQDMTSRDLVQQRRMLPNGDTVWRHSPLIEAALGGGLAILDGLHFVHHSVLNAISSLIHDREIELFDGTRLMSQEKYDDLKKALDLNDDKLKTKIVALAEPPNLSAEASTNWFTPELMNLFLFHHVEPMNVDEEIEVISAKIHNVPEEVERSLLGFVESLKRNTELVPLARLLSTRQILRIMKRLTYYPDDCLYSAIHKACLSRFLPSLMRRNLDNALEECSIRPSEGKQSMYSDDYTCSVSDGYLTIGKTKAKLFHTENSTLIPNILFYDNFEHLRIIENMLRDFMLGEHLLLVGNQGVGKNKVADRFLQLLNLPRQYIQLHRDTTVQTLTVQVTVRDGVIVYEDSPLVKAAKHGHVLVIDEGDKAPTHVTVVLKSLLESGYMHLADGRSIVQQKTHEPLGENCIALHKNFRVIVLANRPGFPFLGNDFYNSLGDLFACHAVDNPSLQSELTMLKKYGPDVPDQVLNMLSSAFHQLRVMYERGSLNYPYSTRELVSIVKHMQQYPNDPLSRVVGNVFDFDNFDKSTRESIFEILSKNGVATSGNGAAQTLEIRLLPKFKLPEPEFSGIWRCATENTVKIDVNRSNLTVTPLNNNSPKLIFVDRIQNRTNLFTEQLATWQLPISDMSMVSDVLSLDGGDIVIATVNPTSIFRLNTLLSNCYRLDLDAGLFRKNDFSRSNFKARLKLSRLNSSKFFDHLLVHEEISDAKLLVNTDLRTVASLDDGTSKTFSSKILGNIFIARSKTPSNGILNRMIPQHDGQQDFAYFHAKDSPLITILNFSTMESIVLTLPFNVSEIFVVQNSMIVQSSEGKFHHVNKDSVDFYVNPVDAEFDMNDLKRCVGISTNSLTLSLGQTLSSNRKSPPSRILFGNFLNDYYGFVSVGYPDEKEHEGKLYKYKRNINSTKSDHSNIVNRASKFTVLPHIGQLIQARPTTEIPDERRVDDSNVDGYLEVIDFNERNVTYIPVPAPKYRPPYPAWYRSISETNFVLNSYGQEGVVTIDSSGGIRTFETSPGSLRNSINAWRKMMGIQNGNPKKITIEKADADFSKLSEPKHGVTDPTGAPHFGGGTFAGGSGGFNTAGLGGAGGPYRLDLGHKEVHQVSDDVKSRIPEHVRQKAREMARRAYAQRLKEIHMSEHEAEMYEKFYARIENYVHRLRVVIESLQAKQKDRQWVKHQTSGDLDEGKIIDGITGEKNIYRRRADKKPEPGAPQQKPKRIRLCPDLSGSMYRFNGYDHRLEKSLEATLMLMKSFEGFEDKIKFEIVGHSGEQSDVELSTLNNPPKDDSDRLKILKSMLAHSQYCMSGDFTLESIALATKICAKEAANFDETFIILLSDANFRRYGISPDMLARMLSPHSLSSNVQENAIHMFAIFIGSLGDEADLLKKRLPPNKAFVCRSTEEIPQIMQQILTSTVV